MARPSLPDCFLTVCGTGRVNWRRLLSGTKRPTAADGWALYPKPPEAGTQPGGCFSGKALLCGWCRMQQPDPVIQLLDSGIERLELFIGFFQCCYLLLRHLN